MSYRKYLMPNDTSPSEIYAATAVESDTDTISRAKAIEALNKLSESTYEVDYGVIDCDDAIGEIEKLPPAQPKRGKWIHISEEMWKCDQCGEISCCSPNFCPDCGAEMMREVTE